MGRGYREIIHFGMSVGCMILLYIINCFISATSPSLLASDTYSWHHPMSDHSTQPSSAPPLSAYPDVGFGQQRCLARYQGLLFFAGQPRGSLLSAVAA